MRACVRRGRRGRPPPCGAWQALTRPCAGGGGRVAQVARAVAVALACLGSLLGRAGAQSWAPGFPKLQFGAAALSPSLSFPESLGSWIPTGGAPQDVILRFKVRDADSAAYFTAGKVTLEHQLAGFAGGDNAWDKTSPHLTALLISAAGSISAAGDRLAAGGAAVLWTARSGTLTVALDNVQAADIADAEIAIVLAAASFVGGKGPVAPSCLERDAPVYVKRVVQAGGAEAPGLRGAVPTSAPVGCFGHATKPFGVIADSWDSKAIGQNANANGVGMDMTITVTLASSRDIYSVTASVKSEVAISGLVGSQTSDSNALALEVHGNELFSALELFETPAETAGTMNTVNTGRWKKETGTLTLTIKDGKRLPAGIPFVFSFKLKLPKAPFVSGDVFIMAKTGTTTVIPNQRMDAASGDAAPLTTRARTLIGARIGQLVSGRGQENTIQVTLMSNFDLQSTTSSISKITVSGLTGSASKDSSPGRQYPVISKSRDSVQGIFSDGSAEDRAGWFKSKGELVLQIVNGRFLRAGTEYVFAVNLLNQDAPQESPLVYIQASGETDTGRVEMQRGEGIEAPLFISDPAMSIAEVSAQPVPKIRP